jgi:hypothetical protein
MERCGGLAGISSLELGKFMRLDIEIVPKFNFRKQGVWNNDSTHACLTLSVQCFQWFSRGHLHMEEEGV